MSWYLWLPSGARKIPPIVRLLFRVSLYDCPAFIASTCLILILFRFPSLPVQIFRYRAAQPHYCFQTAPEAGENENEFDWGAARECATRFSITITISPPTGEVTAAQMRDGCHYASVSLMILSYRRIAFYRKFWEFRTRRNYFKMPMPIADLHTTLVLTPQMRVILAYYAKFLDHFHWCWCNAHSLGLNI